MKLLALVMPMMLAAADLSVTVYEGRMPLADVSVTVLETGREEYTDEKGKAVHARLTNGVYTVVAFLSGYERVIKTVAVARTNAAVPFSLVSAATNVAAEIVVTGKRNEGMVTGQSSIKKEAMFRTTQIAMNDAASALQSLPGVASSGGTFDSRMFIQGGDQSEYFSMMDGIFIPVPQRFAGRISMFNPYVIDRIDLYTAGYPASFGQGLSGILDVKTMVGDRSKWTGFIDLGIAALEAKIEGPITSNLTMFLDVRRTYYDIVAPLFIRDEWRENTQFPYLLDGLFKLAWYISERDILSLSLYGSSEGMDWNMAITFDGLVSSSLPPGATGIDHYSVLNGIAELRYEHRFGENDYLELFTAVMPRSSAAWRVSDGYSRTTSNVDNEMFYQAGANLYINSLPGHKMSVGAIYIPFIANMTSRTNFYQTNASGLYTYLSNFMWSFPEINAHYAGAYVMDDWAVIPQLILQAGLRGEYYFYTPEYQINPRGGIKWEMTKDLSMFVRGGLYSMFPFNWNYINSNTGNPALFSQKAVHAIGGLEFGNSLFAAKAEAFWKRYADVVERDQSNRYLNSGVREVYGADVYFQKKEEKNGWLNGWVSYTYVRGLESIQGLAVPLQPSNSSFIPPYIREHTVAAILELTYRANDVTPGFNWLNGVKLSFDFRFNSGKPYTPGTGVATNMGPGYTNYYVIYGVYNSALTPPLHNLDIKLTIPVSLFTLIDLFGVETTSTTYISFVNVYAMRNVLEYSFRVSASKTLERREILDFPFLATFGMRIDF